MNLKRLLSCISFCCVIFFTIGCSNSKQLAYLQDLNDTSKVQFVDQYPYDPLKFMVDDQIQVAISSTAPEAAQFFNMVPATVGTSGVSGVNSPSQSSISVYTVSPGGNITLPVLGDMQVLGMTSEELKNKVTAALQPYLKDAVVSVKIVNFKVTVIGEVSRPVTIPVNGERINILEAIGAAGDMTAFSHRYNVKVLRKTSTGTEVAHLNFNTSKMMKSPYYQLKQNDIVYVEPSKTKGVSSEAFTTYLPLITSLASLALFIVSIALRF